MCVEHASGGRPSRCVRHMGDSALKVLRVIHGRVVMEIRAFLGLAKVADRAHSVLEREMREMYVLLVREIMRTTWGPTGKFV